MLDEHKRSGLGKGYQRVYAMGEARASVHVQGENNLTRNERVKYQYSSSVSDIPISGNPR